MERITRADLDARVENLNRRIEHTGRFVQVEGRNGYFGLDECEHKPAYSIRLRTITVGTKREIAEFLHAMMVGIDLSRVEPEFSVKA